MRATLTALALTLASTLAQADALPSITCASSSDIQKARTSERVVLCMRPADVLWAAGKYSEHETTTGFDRYGNWERWFFYGHVDTFPVMVEFRDGKVFRYGDLRDLH